MGTDQMTPAEIVKKYKPDVERLLPYVSYFEKMSGLSSSSTFNEDGLSEHSLAFPVYDSTLLRFVKDAENSIFMDRNYRYVYTRNHIKTYQDELAAIEKCTIQQLETIGGILSNYVYGGRTKGVVWNQGVKNGVFLAAILKLQELIHFWESSK